MIKTLSTYILQPHGSESIQSLLTQTNKITQKIRSLSQKIDQIPFEAVPAQQKLDRIESVLSKSEEQLSLEYESLQKQKAILARLVSFVKQYLVNSQDLRLLQKNHLQLAALLQEAERQGDPDVQVRKMRAWVDKIRQNLEKKLCDLVGVFNTHIRIKQKQIQILSDILTQQIVSQFSKSISNSIFEYDVPTFSYILRVPQQIQKENPMQAQNTILRAERRTIIFKSEQSQKYFPQILKAIAQTKQIYRIIEKSLPQSLQHIFIIGTQKSFQYLKSQLQYILPYLSLQHRKQAVENLDIRKPEQSTLYDILVKLRLKGQDGEMMQSNINQLVQKIKANNLLMEEVILFLEICQNQGKILNIGFYLCEQLLERLESVLQYRMIERLLEIREDMRFKIHHPQ